MDLKKILGDKYKEDMTFADIEKALKNVELIEASVLNDYVLKAKYDKASSDAADWKKKYRATLDEKEQAELEMKEANEAREKEYETLKRQVRVGEYEKKHLGMGYDEKSAKRIADALYDGDMETVFDLQSKFIESTKKEVKKQNMIDTPKPPAGSEDKVSMTKKIKDLSATELQKIYKDNPDEFNELTKKEE